MTLFLCFDVVGRGFDGRRAAGVFLIDAVNPPIACYTTGLPIAKVETNDSYFCV